MTRMRRFPQRPPMAARSLSPALMLLLVAGLPAETLAHSSEAGIVLLLPTGHYLVAATAVVALTFLLVSALPAGLIRSLLGASLRLPPVPMPRAEHVSVFAFLILAIMVAAGLCGSRDPLTNPLPSLIWTLFWVVLLFAHGLVGPLWRALNPWSGPLALLRLVSGRAIGLKPRRVLPARLGQSLAALQFLAFAWFELVDPAPEDPRRLALAVAAYWLANLIAMGIFGQAIWSARGEPFSIVFGLLGRLAPLQWQAVAAGPTRQHPWIWQRPVIGFPGRCFLADPPLPLSTILLVLLTLSSVSFDGLSTTFVWLAATGVNPLDFPGRSAVLPTSSLGLVLAWGLFALIYFATIWLGARLAGLPDVRALAGRLIISILPISLAFQFAHYLTLALVGLQDLYVALRDPFATGHALFGDGSYRVTTSFLNDFDSVERIFNAQAGAVTLGHGLAVILAHALIRERIETRGHRLLFEIPFTLLMILFTAFGLWLLSTPRL